MGEQPKKLIQYVLAIVPQAVALLPHPLTSSKSQCQLDAEVGIGALLSVQDARLSTQMNSTLSLQMHGCVLSTCICKKKMVFFLAE